MLEAVKARIAEREAEQIRVVGRVPEGEDYLWIGASDVSVMCGGLGLAIQQTLAFGRPMIVADEPGVDGELVRHGETGWRYPKGDVNALAEAVNSVLSDPEGCSVIARRGQDLVRNEVHVDGMVDGFLAALARAGVRLGS
jgi:glycosyltransferase involved in cell wall biosynthesis